MFHHVFLFAIILSSIIDDQHNLVCITANELFLKFMHTYTNIPFGALSLDNQRPVFFLFYYFFVVALWYRF